MKWIKKENIFIFLLTPYRQTYDDEINSKKTFFFYVKDIDTTEPTRQKTSIKKDRVLPKSLKNYSSNSYFITEYIFLI